MMHRHPPNASLFLAAAGPEPIRGAPALLGVPYDGTTSFRPGTRFGPDALRAVSDGIETYSPEQDRDLEDFSFADLGNLDIPHAAPETVYEIVHDAVTELLGTDAVPFLLGGEHSITPGAVHAVLEKHPDLCVIQIDAHADLRESFNGARHSHASAMRRVLDKLPADRLLQVGIRSGTREEFQELRETGRLVSADAENLTKKLDESGFHNRPCYLTLDLDVFDPAFFPGTGTPEPGGIDWPAFEAFRAALPWNNVVALDAVELSPHYDHTGRSSVLAAKVVRECLLSLAK